MAKMLAATQILSMVIRPALAKINLWSRSAEELVLGTAIVESGLTWFRQWGDGPALGLWQVEPSTQNDLYTAQRFADCVITESRTLCLRLVTSKARGNIGKLEQ